MSDQTAITEPSAGQIFRVWFALGLQSFGGGSSLTLIHRVIVEQYGWISETAFTRNWALCQMCPGINLVAFTLLCGKQTAGRKGMIFSLLGMLLPTVSIIILMTAVYAQIRSSVVVTKALNAIIPASVGLGVFSAYTMAREPIQQSHTEGAGSLALSIAIIVICAALMLFSRTPVFVLLLGSGALLGLVALWKSRKEAP